MKVNLTVEKLEITGVIRTYQETIWIEDENHEKGGSLQVVEKYYPIPRIAIDFVAIRDISMDIGTTYTDGMNLFYASEKNKIQNADIHMERFSIPRELHPIARAYIENKERKVTGAITQEGAPCHDGILDEEHIKKAKRIDLWLTSHGANKIFDIVFDGNASIIGISKGFGRGYFIELAPVDITHNIGNGSGMPLKIKF